MIFVSSHVLLLLRIRFWLVIAALLCLAIELVLLGVIPNPLESEPISTGSHEQVPRPRPPYKKIPASKIRLRRHKMSHPPPDYKKPVPRKDGLSLEYLLDGASNHPVKGPIYLDDRIENIPSMWGWEPRCMPGYGRSGLSRVSPRLSNFSAIINPKDVPSDLNNYFYAHTLYSNVTGEHWTIGIDAGVSVWSCAPVYRHTTSTSPSASQPTHLSFVATRPSRPRNKATWAQLESDQSNSTVPPLLTTTSSKKNNQARTSKLANKQDFECLVYTDTGTIILSAEVSGATAHDLVVVTCNISILSSTILNQLISPDTITPTLALHDKSLNIYWNFSKPCNPPLLRNDVTEKEKPLELIMNRKYWQSVNRPSTHRLTAVLVLDAEKLCFLDSWLSHARALGFDHIYIYKQVLFSSKLDEIDKILLTHVKKGFVTVVPFFDAHYGCNEPNEQLRRYKCHIKPDHYYALYQDALQRFRASWMLVTDVNELVFLPQSSMQPPGSGLKNTSTSNSTQSLFQVLERDSSHWGRHTTQASLSGYSFGTGRKQSSRPYCIAGDSEDPFSHPKARSEYPKVSPHWLLRAHLPFVLSDATTQFSSMNVRLDRFLRQFEGALPQNNVINL